MSKNLRFNKGDLVEVHKNFRIVGSGGFSFGPRIIGKQTVLIRMLQPGNSFLALTGTDSASWRNNRKLWLEIMTPAGPRTVWASAFKMRLV
jgi:hypothetical protein